MNPANPFRSQHVDGTLNPLGNTISRFHFVVLDIDDANTQLQLVQSGEVDIAYSLDPDNASLVEEDENLQLASGPTLAIEYMALHTLDDPGGPLANMLVNGLFRHFGPVLVLKEEPEPKLAIVRRLPTCVWVKELVDDGALMSYGVDQRAIARRVAVYVDRILKGENPAEMPVEQPTKFELILNMKTAKALGLTIAPAILLRAEQIIE